MLIKAEGISKKFFREGGESNYFYAVKETDFESDAGLTEIVGKSGSGKSTFLSMLAGLLTPTSGKVFINDKDIYSLKDKERSRLRNKVIGIVPQGQTGINALTVLENVLLPTSFYKSENNGEKYALELLERLDIFHLKNSYPNEISGGELRRMAIARALINNPKIVMADEPTGDLDEENTEIVLKHLKSIADSGTAVIMVTHEKDAERYADRIFRITNGNLSRI